MFRPGPKGHPKGPFGFPLFGPLRTPYGYPPHTPHMGWWWSTPYATSYTSCVSGGVGVKGAYGGIMGTWHAHAHAHDVGPHATKWGGPHEWSK